MEWVSWVLFEEIAALAALLFTVNFALLVYWRRSERWQPLAIGLVGAIVLLTVQTLVVTRREHALRVLAAIETDVLAERTDALAAALAPQFDASGMAKSEFLTYVERQYDRRTVRSLRRGAVRVGESLPDRFVVTAAYQVDLMSDGFAGVLPTNWDITFVQTEAGWQILTVQPRYIPGLTSPSWRQLAGN